jgi:hypothetical protein
MAKEKVDEQTSAPAVVQVVDQDPPAGGSYTRNEDGSLTRTEGPEIEQPVEQPKE